MLYQEDMAKRLSVGYARASACAYGAESPEFVHRQDFNFLEGTLRCPSKNFDAVTRALSYWNVLPS